jgi:hypothetical protein
MGEECYVIIKKGPNQGFQKLNISPYSVEEKKFRMLHLLYPICTMMGLDYSTEGNPELFPNVRNSDVLTAENRISLADILKQYEEAPLFWPKASEKAIEMVQQQFQKPPVVITLRETYTKDRNSNTKEWVQFAKHVSKTNQVVFVRDTDCWNGPLLYKNKGESGYNQFMTFPVASVDLDMRLALYKCAKINFSVGGGSTNLLRFSTDIPYRTFRYMRTKKTVDSLHIFKEEELHKMLNSCSEEQLKEEKPFSMISQESIEKQLIESGQNKISVLTNQGGLCVLNFDDSKNGGTGTKSKGAGTKESLINQGFPPGSQFPWHTENQKLIWKDDTFENLKEEYENWLESYDR